jgi:hypothetical protein
VIGSDQLATLIVMGTGLILLGLVPGLLQNCADGICDLTDLLLIRMGHASRSRAEFNEPHWFALAGVALIAVTLLAYISN